MRVILSKNEFEENYIAEKLKKIQLFEGTSRYIYLDKSKKMVYMKDIKNTGDDYHVYTVNHFNNIVHLQPSIISQDEINLFNELIAGKLVEGNEKNFLSMRKSIQPQVPNNHDILQSLNQLRYNTNQSIRKNHIDEIITLKSSAPDTKEKDYLNRLFIKYWTTDKSNINFDKDGVDGLYAYPDAFIWKFHYEFERFNNEEALKFREFLMVPGIHELVKKGLFNWGDLQTCRHLNPAQAMQLVNIYNENSNIWKSVGRPKLIDLVFKNAQGYDVVTKEEAHEIVKNSLFIPKFVVTHDMILRRLGHYQNINQASDSQPHESKGIEFDLATQQKDQSTSLKESSLSGFIGFWNPKTVNEKDSNQTVLEQLHSLKF